MEKTKKCPYCGEEILIEAKKCKHCGEWLEEEKIAINNSSVNEEDECDEIEIPENEQPFVDKGFFGYYMERIWRFHKFDTNGCVSRSEYWKFILCNTLVSILFLACFKIMALALSIHHEKTGYIIGLVILCGYMLLYSIMSICMLVRRLHDIDKSGWLWLLSFVPILNIYLIYLLCKKGKTHDADVPFKQRDTLQTVLVILFSIALMVSSNMLSKEFAVEKTSTINELEQDMYEDNGDNGDNDADGEDTNVSETIFDEENGFCGTFKFNGFMEDAANEYEVSLELNFEESNKADGYIQYGDGTKKHPVKATYSDGTIKVVEYDEEGELSGNELSLNIDFDNSTCSGYYSTFNGHGMSVEMLIGQ